MSSGRKWLLRWKFTVSPVLPNCSNLIDYYLIHWTSQCCVFSFNLDHTSNIVFDLYYLNYSAHVPSVPWCIVYQKHNILPPGVFSKKDCYIKRKWKQIQYLADLFWSRWRKEYLPILQARQKWTKQNRNMKVGDIVLLGVSTFKSEMSFDISVMGLPFKILSTSQKSVTRPSSDKWIFCSCMTE
jgi:hypothetical protein